MTAQSPIAWAVYGGKSGVLRYVLQDEERVFELTENGYIARPLFEHPVPTPPADDVREAVAVKRWCSYFGCRVVVYEADDSYGQGCPVCGHVGEAGEVRPHGTVTDTEVEAAAQAMFEDPLYDAKYTWAEMVTEDPSRAGIWRADARRVLEAAREVHP